MLFWGTAYLVKKVLRKSSQAFPEHKYKIKFPLNRAKANASAILNRDLTTKENLL